MATITRLTQILNGLAQNQDLTTSTLVVSSITIGGPSGTNLTQTLLNSFLTSVTAASGSGIVSTQTGQSIALTVDSTVIRTTGINAFAANQSMGGFNLIDLASPVNSTDAATKGYADNLINGLSWKEVVTASTTAALGAYTYSNGSSGVGATLTSTTNVTLPAQDGITLIVGNRLLVQFETGSNAPYNGIYSVTQLGSGTTPWILTRTTDADTGADLVGATVMIDQGTLYGGFAYRQSTPATITVGTTNISFIAFSSGLSYTFNNGLALSGSTVNVVPGNASLLASPGSLIVQENALGAIITTSTGLAIQLQSTNPSLVINGSNQLGVNLNTSGAIISGASGLAIQLESVDPSLEISSNQLGVNLNAAGAISKTTTGLSVNVDGSTIAINGSDQLSIPNGGITDVQINSSALGSGLTGGSGTPISITAAPKSQISLIAGQAFAANTSYIVRWGLGANSETAGDVYAANAATAATSNEYLGIGMFNSPTAVSIGGSINVVVLGSLTLGSSDTAFTSTQVGQPIYLSDVTAGAFTTTPTSTIGSAVYRIGEVQNTNMIWIDTKQLNGIN